MNKRLKILLTIILSFICMNKVNALYYGASGTTFTGLNKNCSTNNCNYDSTSRLITQVRLYYVDQGSFAQIGNTVYYADTNSYNLLKNTELKVFQMSEFNSLITASDRYESAKTAIINKTLTNNVINSNGVELMKALVGYDNYNEILRKDSEPWSGKGTPRGYRLVVEPAFIVINPTFGNGDKYAMITTRGKFIEYLRGKTAALPSMDTEQLILRNRTLDVGIPGRTQDQCTKAALIPSLYADMSYGCGYRMIGDRYINRTCYNKVMGKSGDSTCVNTDKNNVSKYSELYSNSTCTNDNKTNTKYGSYKTSNGTCKLYCKEEALVSLPGNISNPQLRGSYFAWPSVDENSLYKMSIKSYLKCTILDEGGDSNTVASTVTRKCPDGYESYNETTCRSKTDKKSLKCSSGVERNKFCYLQKKPDLYVDAKTTKVIEKKCPSNCTSLTKKTCKNSKQKLLSDGFCYDVSESTYVNSIQKEVAIYTTGCDYGHYFGEDKLCHTDYKLKTKKSPCNSKMPNKQYQDCLKNNPTTTYKSCAHAPGYWLDDHQVQCVGYPTSKKTGTNYKNVCPSDGYNYDEDIYIINGKKMCRRWCPGESTRFKYNNTDVKYYCKDNKTTPLSEGTCVKGNNEYVVCEKKCLEGKEKNGQCVKNVDPYCESGTLIKVNNVNKCIKCPPNTVIDKDDNGKYTGQCIYNKQNRNCDSGYIEVNGSCYKQANKTLNYSCPTGYTISSDNQTCTKTCNKNTLSGGLESTIKNNKIDAKLTAGDNKKIDEQLVIYDDKVEKVDSTNYIRTAKFKIADNKNRFFNKITGAVSDSGPASSIIFDRGQGVVSLSRSNEILEEQKTKEYKLTISNIKVGTGNKFDIDDYTCKFTITEIPPCICPAGTANAGKKISEIVSSFGIVLKNDLKCPGLIKEYCDYKPEQYTCKSTTTGNPINITTCVNNQIKNKKTPVDAYEICKANEPECTNDTCINIKTGAKENIKQCLDEGNSRKVCEVISGCAKNTCTGKCTSNTKELNGMIYKLKKCDGKYCNFETYCLNTTNTSISSITCVESKLGTSDIIESLNKNEISLNLLESAIKSCKPTICEKGPIALFRVIDLKHPFPGTIGNDRNPGYNWDDADLIKEKITNARNADGNKLYQKEPLMTITLTPADVKEIRKYNDKKFYNDFNLKCVNNNSANCISSFLHVKETINLNVKFSSNCNLNLSSKVEQFNKCYNSNN